MKFETTVGQYQMASPFCFFKKPLSWVAAALVLALVFTAFVSFGSLSVVFTSILVIISTVLFTFTKQEPVTPVEKSVTEDVLYSDHDQEEEVSSPRIEDVESMEEDESEVLTSVKNEREEETLIEHQIHNDYSARSPDLLSESESLNHLSTSEDSEVDWPFLDIVCQSPDCSDGSISDEESLIEISLPSGHYVGHKNQEVPKPNLQQKVPADFMPHSILKQHSLIELLGEINDINEEDNLIEIDISMGSIKCSRFEIEA